MPTKLPRPSLLASCVLVWLCFLTGRGGCGWERVARAQQARTAKSFDGDLFQPAIGPKNFLSLEAPEVLAHGRFAFGLDFDFQRHPYRLETTDQNTGLGLPTSYPIRSQIRGELQAAVGLFDQLQLGIALPLTFAIRGDEIDPSSGLPYGGGSELSTSGIGDLRFEVKGQILSAGDDDQFILAALLGGTAPTGDSNAYLGERGPTGRLKALASLQLDRLRLGAGVGVLLRESTTTLGAKVGNQLLYGLAASFQALKRLDLLAELSGRSGLGGFGDLAFGFNQPWWDENPVEVDVAARAYVTGMLAFTGGLGAGLGKGIGAPSARVFLGVAFTPDFRDADHDGVYDADDRCPDQPEDRDGYKDDDGCPDPDNDGDGIPDVVDKCPNDPEDFDQFEDTDGCPELDNDKDGIPDLNDPCPNAAEDGRGKRPHDGCPSTSEDSDGDGVNDTIDKCPDEPEDRDGFEDSDGCPDPDNDGDGIPDGFDNCPNDPEDADGFEDEDGCPDLDNDKDGIPDKDDKCPNKPETLNLIDDEDGCPDPGAEVVILRDDQIQVTERLPFSVRAGKAELKEIGARIARLISLVLKGHPEIRRLTIEVTGEKLTKDTAQLRADAIRDAIVRNGIAPDRLVPVGVGPGPSSVEFHIAEKAPPRSPSPSAAAGVPKTPDGSQDGSKNGSGPSPAVPQTPPATAPPP